MNLFKCQLLKDPLQFSSELTGRMHPEGAVETVNAGFEYFFILIVLKY